MDFFKTYFIDPIYYNTGYNVVNTTVFAVVLIAAVFLTYKLLVRMKIKIDKSFFFGIIPFIAMGGILRAYEDLLEATGAHPFSAFTMVDYAGVSRNLLLISPFIYVVIFAIALASLVAAKLVGDNRKIDYWKIWFAVGAVVDLIALSQMRFVSLFALWSVAAITIAWVVALFAVKQVAIKKNIKKLSNLLTNENMFLIDAHLFEATTTFVAIQFPQQLGASYFEQHVVAGFFIAQLGAASFFLLKLAVVPLVLYYFDKELSEKKDAQMRTFLKLIVLILALGPGLRNFLRLVMGV